MITPFGHTNLLNGVPYLHIVPGFAAHPLASCILCVPLGEWRAENCQIELLIASSKRYDDLIVVARIL